MFVVSAGHYIAAILKEAKDFKAFINATPDDQLCKLTYDAYPLNGYPFYIIEDRRQVYERFVFWPSKESAEGELTNELKEASEKKHHRTLNLYEVTEDFWVKGEEGQDQMGILDHSHFGICGKCGKQGKGLPKLLELEECNCKDSTL